MRLGRGWICVGGGLCLTAAFVVQRVWGQMPLRPTIPTAPPALQPSNPPVTNIPLPPPPPSSQPTIKVQVPLANGSLAPLPPVPPGAPREPSLVPLPLPPGPAAALPVQVPPIPATLLSAPPAVPAPPAPLGAPAAAPAPTLPAPEAPPALTAPNLPTSPVPSTPVLTPIPTTTATSFKPAESSVSERPGKQEPTVSIEWVGPANARFNQPLACQIHVRNHGTGPVHQVVVKPNLPNDVKIKASEPPLTPEEVSTGWNLGTLQPGQARKIDVTILPQRRGYQNYSATVTFAATTLHLTEVREPLLEIKVKAPEKLMAGDPAPIQFTLSNPGDGTTEAVKVRAVLPEGLEHPRGQAFEIDAGNLAPKESRTLLLACVAKGSGKMKATIVASAEGNLTATDVVNLEVLLPRLDLVLSGPKLRFVERPARYTLKVTNPGNAPAQAVVLNEVVPAGFKFQSASHHGRFDAATRTVQWSLGELPPGQARELSFDLIPTIPGDHRLAAAVESARGVRSESTVSTRVEGLSNLVLEVANADNPVEVGADANYEIRIANGGTKIESNVELICTLPEGVEFREARSAAGVKFRVEGRNVIFEPITRLAPRAEVIFGVTVKSRMPGDVRFRARVRAEGITDALLREETTKFYDDNAVR